MPLVLNQSSIVPALQGFVYSLQMGAGQLLSIGSNYYYVTIAQVGPILSITNLLTVYKSSDILTWNAGVTLPPGVGGSNVTCQDAPCVVVGTNIYVIGTFIAAGVVSLQVRIYDTLTDTFSESALGPVQGGAGNQLWSISAQNDGTLVVSSTIVGPSTKYQIYDPVLDSWSGPFTIANVASRVVNQVHDPVTDFTYIFYVETLGDLHCYTIDPLGVNTNVLVATGWSFPNGKLGTAYVSAADSSVHLLANFGTSLKEYASALTNPPSFTLNVVQLESGLPAGNEITPYDQIAGTGWFMLDIGGVLYTFYAVDNGFLDNASSESYIYYNTWSGAAWSVPTLLYTTPIPAELLTPYGTVAADGTVVLLLGLIDPTLWPAYASLSNVVLYSTVFTPAIFAYLNAQSLLPVILPDPSKTGCP